MHPNPLDPAHHPRRFQLLLLAFAAIIAWAHYGCGPSSLEIHAGAAQASRELNSGAVELLEEECHERVTAAARNSEVSVVEAEEAAREILRHCEAAEQAQNAFAAALDVWVGSLLAAVANDDGFDVKSSVELARRAFIFYHEMQQAAAEAGVDLPEVPTIIAKLIQVGREAS